MFEIYPVTNSLFDNKIEFFCEFVNSFYKNNLQKFLRIYVELERKIFEDFELPHSALRKGETPRFFEGIILYE